MTDLDWMQQALNLAARGRGQVEPNPMVGAIVVRGGVQVGAGWHRRYGEAHAEVHALNEAGALARGATLYVTLEPCCHFGKTPPCVDAVIAAGIKRVVAAMADPFPRVAGGGFAKLRAAGIEVVSGILQTEARRLNAPYLTLLTHNRPYVHAKWAMTLDGRIATRTGHSQWISGEESRRRVHELRGRVDAIIVGTGTVRADDPQLTARPAGPRTAMRIVLSSDGRLPEQCRLLQTARDVPVLVAGPRIAEPEKLEALGCEVLQVDSIPALLTNLGQRRFTNVLVEGGAAVLGSFRDAQLIDELHVYVAPVLIGGAAAPGPIAGVGSEIIGDGLKLDEWTWEPSGADLYLNGRIRTSYTA